MSEQLAQWQGEFGKAYVDRNVVDWSSRVDGFRQMIPPDVKSIFEVGANRCHNLVALDEVFQGSVELGGCEPSTYAWRKGGYRADVCWCSVYELGDDHWSRDLVFTSGVLIHVPPDRLDEALSNIYALAAKYILAIEYDGNDEMIDYRGHQDMLWKRDYGKHYQRLFPQLELVKSGVAPAGFERATFWLLQK